MSLVAQLAQGAIILMVVAAAISFLRLVRGPDLADRIVAFDLISIQVIGIICSTAIITQEPLLLDAAIILALLAFLATVALARYMERRIGHPRRGPRA